MRIVVIGGTGHVGTYLVPRLVSAGHEVICVSRGERDPYQPHPAWHEVERVIIDRESAEHHNLFGPQIQAFNTDVVIDMICFTQKSAEHLVNALRDKVQHLLVCGTIWIHGRSVEVPTPEEHNRNPFGDYGINKCQLTDYLLGEARLNRFPVTVLHPGHIVGPGWVPVNPLGNLNPQVFAKLILGEEVALPTLGMETLHHVHADDVAQAFEKALYHWNAAVGEDFHVVSETALTLRGYAEAVASWFGKDVNLKEQAGDDWKADLSDEDVRMTWDHILRSPNCSIEKARRHLGYQPRYSSLEAIYEAVQWLIEHKVISLLTVEG
jgi:nucleoside-diphosphate-sugar epimerase